MKIKRALLSLLIAAIAGGTVFAQELERVTLARLAPSALLWLHAIAEDQDLYALHGVQVEAVQTQSSAALVQAVASGSADAGIALGDNAMLAIDEGGDLVIAGAILHKPILRLLGSVETIEELRGTNVTGGAVTGGTSDLLLYQLLQGGVQPNEVQVVGVTNSADRLVGFQNGQLGGGLLIAPFDVLALRDGFHLIDVYEDYWLQTPLVLNRSWAEANPAAASGLTQALAEAAGWIYDPDNRSEAVRILAEYTGIDADIVEEAYDFIVLEQQAISPDLSVPEQSLYSIVEIRQAVHGGEIDSFEFSDYYDPTYLGE